VGSFAVQFARLAGATVIATASSGNLPFLHLLGADQAIDYTTTDFERAVRPVDVVLDLIGGSTQDRSWSLVKPGGLLISTVTLPSRERATDRGIMALRMRTKSRGDQLVQIGELIAQGGIKVFVDKVFPLGEVEEALRLSRQGHCRGKIVVNIDHDACQPFS